MKTKSSQKYSLGDVISKLINKRLNPLTQRRKLFSSGKPATPSLQQLDLFDFESKRIQAIKCEKQKNQSQNKPVCLADLQIYYDSKRNYSRLFESNKVYSNVICNRSKNNDDGNPQALQKKDLLYAYIKRKQNSGQLKKYFDKTNTKMAHLFRETFVNLREGQKRKTQEQSPSLFYLTVRSKDKVTFKIKGGKKAKRNTLERRNSLYQTFYK